jgi:hypothetical protein
MTLKSKEKSNTYTYPPSLSSLSISVSYLLKSIGITRDFAMISPICPSVSIKGHLKRPRAVADRTQREGIGPNADRLQ